MGQVFVATFRVLDRLLNKFEDLAMVVSMSLITVVITTQVVLRYGFGTNVGWAAELARFTVIWMSFIGAAMAVRLGKHIAVDLLKALLPGRFHSLLLGVSALIGLVFSLLIIFYGQEVVALSWRTGQLSPAMEAPMYIIYLIFPVGGGLLALRFAQVFVAVMRGQDADQLPATFETDVPGNAGK